MKREGGVSADGRGSLADLEEIGEASPQALAFE